MVQGKKKREAQTTTFRCQDENIPKSEQMELLGVSFDNKLKFNNHI